MAVLLMAMAPPSTTAPRQSRPQPSPKRMNSHARNALPIRAPAKVSITCDIPSPNTRVRMLRSLGRLNSSPMTNIRNTTPNSARYFTLAESAAKPSAWGPISTPTDR